MEKQIYIHYGSTKFDPTFKYPIKNERHWVKPGGGLWASRINASFGWKDWCESEQFRECNPQDSFQFTIKDGANIAIISTVEDLKKLPMTEDCKWKEERSWFDHYWIDFEKCLEIGIDAVELCIYGDEYENADYSDLHYSLYGWDCDSIIILNPNIVEQMEV